MCIFIFLERVHLIELLHVFATYMLPRELPRLYPGTYQPTKSSFLRALHLDKFERLHSILHPVSLNFIIFPLDHYFEAS
jgi:hypothetical protein